MEDAQAKMAFATTNVLYKVFKVMPFGLCNAPVTFQRLMQKDQSGLGGQNPFCGKFIDNTVVYYDSVQEHLEYLRHLFSRLNRVVGCHGLGETRVVHVYSG